MTDKIKEKLKRKEDPIKKKLKAEKNTAKNSRILDTLKKEKLEWRKNIDYQTSQKIINKLKEEYKKHYQPTLDVSQIKNNYHLSLTDKSIQNPFIVSPGLVEIIKQCTREHQGRERKARAIYDWIEENIQYGKGINNYSNSEEVLKQKSGVCGEMAFVYITMARSIGLDSAFVEVDRDCQGKEVAHACAMVNIGGRKILVDPAYHTFDIKHQEYQVLTDLEVLERFNQWRGEKKTWKIFGIF